MIFNNYLNSLKGKRVFVIGAGVSNTPLIEALLAFGIDVTVCDMRTLSELGAAADNFENRGAKLKLGESYLSDINADIIFRTPGIMPWIPEFKKAVADGAELTSEMEVFIKLCPCKIIGITGSDGKTTTTSIIGSILKNAGKTVHVGGNIGTPLLSRVDSIQPNDIAVLELSSFQLISMRQSPHISIVTNLSPNHLDVHKDMVEYADAKLNIVLYQKSSDRAVLNYDNSYTRNYAQSTDAQVTFFSRLEKLKNGVYLDNGVIYESKDGVATKILSADDIVLPGIHNVENYMAAIAAVQGLATSDAIVKTAKEFSGVNHRIEFVGELNGARYYNDSIATTPSRSIAALNAFDKKAVVLIAGGKGKELSYDELAKVAVERTKAIMLIGEEAQAIRTAIMSAPGFDDEMPIQIHSTLESAVKAAGKIAQEGDIILFSPACASFDMFRNFEERGEAFREIVRGEELLS